MLKIAVLISGSGSNLQAIIDNIDLGYLNCSIEMVISDREDAYGLERARQKGITTFVFDRKIYKATLSKEIMRVTQGKVDLIVLAGFLSIVDKKLVGCFKNKIINIHPSLIPAFCGPKMYGLKVHESAINYGVKYSGCTVHYVDEGTDTGEIICQKVVPIYPEDTAKDLQQRVLFEEHKALSETIKLIEERMELQ